MHIKIYKKLQIKENIRLITTTLQKDHNILCRQQFKKQRFQASIRNSFINPRYITFWKIKQSNVIQLNDRILITTSFKYWY